MEQVKEEQEKKEARQPQQEPLSLCPMCHLHTGRRIRNKVYCMNCGYIES